jgi:heme-degrading monooxygenase HmoA
MIIRVTRGHLGGADADEFIRVSEERTMAAARGMPGLRSFHIGVDRQAGTFCGVSMWDTMEQSQAIGAHRAALEALGARFEAPETFEVVSQL